MKNILLGCLTAILFVACSSDKKSNMFVKGEIKGLKKGTLYLEKQVDTSFIAVDSVSLDGISTFALSDVLESPQIYYLTLDNSKEKRLFFFGDKGEITISTKLDKFVFAAKIDGLKNQELLDEYKEMMKKFRDKNLELIKKEFEAKKDNDSLRIDSILDASNKLTRSRYLYTTNYAVSNAHAEIAPYLALTELYNANIKLLDTINNSLSDKVKTSKYGKELDKYIKEIKNKD